MKLVRSSDLAPAVKQLIGRVGVVPRDLAESERQEQAVHLALLKALPFVDRLQVLREVRQAMTEMGATTRRARKRARRFRYASLLREKLGLREFW